MRLDEREETIFRKEIAATPDEEKVMEIVTSWIEAGIARGREEGIARGREEGIARGREEGRQAEAFRIVAALLQRRLGPLPSPVADRISTLPVTALEALSEHALDLTSLADLEDWLARCR